VHEVKEFFREVAISLKKEPTSFDEIADKLIAGGFETKDQLVFNRKFAAEDLGINLLIQNEIKKMLLKGKNN
jgi:hypothetical protein